VDLLFLDFGGFKWIYLFRVGYDETDPDGVYSRQDQHPEDRVPRIPVFLESSSIVLEFRRIGPILPNVVLLESYIYFSEFHFLDRTRRNVLIFW
jgi:hypothetical protein